MEPKDRGPLRAAESIERVLDAERACEQSLDETRSRAEGIVAAARIREEVIRKRADRRLVRIHEAVKDRVDAEIARLRAEYENPENADAGRSQYVIGQDALTKAVERLAARLTGDGEHDAP